MSDIDGFEFLFDCSTKRPKPDMRHAACTFVDFYTRVVIRVDSRPSCRSRWRRDQVTAIAKWITEIPWLLWSSICA